MKLPACLAGPGRGPGAGAEAVGTRGLKGRLGDTVCASRVRGGVLLPFNSALLFSDALRLHEQSHIGLMAINSSGGHLFSL